MDETGMRVCRYCRQIAFPINLHECSPYDLKKRVTDMERQLQNYTEQAMFHMKHQKEGNNHAPSLLD